MWRQLVVLLWTFVAINSGKKVGSQYGSLVNEALEDTFQTFEGTQVGLYGAKVAYDYSVVRDLCHNLIGTADYDRVACCTPNDVRHLYNVLIDDNKLVMFVENPKDYENKGEGKLPPVQSVLSRQKVSNSLPIEYRQGPLVPTQHCTRYFNGTLHFPGRSTVYNVYHALGDNVLPLVGQMILDFYLAADLLYEPRMILTNFQQHSKDPLRQVSSQKSARQNNPANGGLKSEENVVQHLRLMEDVMSAGSISFSQASGMCFRRLVWGHGPHMFYTASLARLRRLVSHFTRSFTLKLLAQFSLERGSNSLWHRWDEGPTSSIVDSKASQHVASLSAPGTYNVERWRHPITRAPLKAIVFSRGTSGRGRTIGREALLVQVLQQRGVQVFICCDYTNTSLEQQLYYAAHADMIIGIHGAALTHGVFMAPGTIAFELKTLYAYESVLFPLISDGHDGLHAQVNIKKYFVPGGQRPIDLALLKRILAVLDQTLELQHSLQLYGNATGQDVDHRNPRKLLMKEDVVKATINGDSRLSQERYLQQQRQNVRKINNNKSLHSQQRAKAGHLNNRNSNNDETSNEDITVGGPPPLTAAQLQQQRAHLQFIFQQLSPRHRCSLNKQLPAEHWFAHGNSGFLDSKSQSNLSVSAIVAVPNAQEITGDFVFATACRAFDAASERSQGKLRLTGDFSGVTSETSKSKRNSKSGTKRSRESTKDNNVVVTSADVIDFYTHPLGPHQPVHKMLCEHSLYQAWRLALETGQDEGIHCRMCDPFVL